MAIQILAEAQAELAAITSYYQEQASIQVARAFLHEVERVFNLLLDFSEMGAPVSKRLRMMPLRHFPYRAIYRVQHHQIIVLAMAAQRRRPGYWQNASKHNKARRLRPLRE